MTPDPTTRAETYPYFLQEAPELLQVLEQGLLSLREDCSLNQINNLMRATHTLKGAAASIGLETIASVAHSLEDIFRALCKPDISIDAEVEALLFEGFECLRLPLTAELTGGSVDRTEVLDRTAVIFARLQEKLGDCFDTEMNIPTSAELGFDVTLSIFEVGVAQRLDQIETVLNGGQPDEIATTLQEQAEIFLGLAESLSLPGFVAIAQATIAALENYPDRAIAIAQTALADFRAGATAVLAGDRTEGGQPSQGLLELADLSSSSTNTSTSLSVIPNGELSLNQSQDEELPNLLLENIWGGQAAPESLASALDSALDAEQVTTSIEEPTSPDAEQVTTSSIEEPASPAPEKLNPTHKIPSSGAPTSTPVVRVLVEHLDQLNYSVGELLTNENRSTLQTEQLQATVQTLLQRLKHHQQLLSQLRDFSNPQFVESSQPSQANRGWQKTRNQKREQQRDSDIYNQESFKVSWAISDRQLPSKQVARSLIQASFDSLELDQYNDSQLLVQSIMDDTVQLVEAADAIDLFARQSNQTSKKQHRLLTDAREALMAARMLPLGDILERFPRVLQQLETLHNKQIVLKLRGTEVMADKVVAEKLYEPLLHLIRNAFDHGIELSSVRKQRGKAERGEIEICAYHQGRNLAIEIRDDGEGLNFERIRQRAVERGSLSLKEADSLNQAQLADLIFEPGFSTTSVVNDLSGRGIGLDVVRKQIMGLQGSISVRSENHRGTMFTLQIPLSLSIAKSLICQSGSQTYALLTDAIEQILLPGPDQIREQYNGKVLRWSKDGDEQWLPLYSLAKVIDYNSPMPQLLNSHPKPPLVSKSQGMPIIVIRYHSSLIGLEVDELIGEQEFVIRPLGSMIATPSYVHGASILADGRLTLAIDGSALAQKLLNSQTSISHNSTIDGDWVHSAPHLLSSKFPQQQLSAADTALPGLANTDFRDRLGNRILIVDDSITTRQTISLTLQKAGYQVFQAKDGYEAIEQLQRQPDIQLVLCDLDMPRMNGFEFLKHYQQDPDLAEIPVIILTSRSGEKHRLLASHLGARAYMTKPYIENQLLAMLADIFQTSSTGQLH
jgi:two-component system, chemotaxis family, sensor histidine kinase and response regulator PixL